MRKEGREDFVVISKKKEEKNPQNTNNWQRTICSQLTDPAVDTQACTSTHICPGHITQFDSPSLNCTVHKLLVSQKFMSKSGFFFCLISSVHPLVLSLVTPPLQQRLFSPIQPRFFIFYLFIVVLWKVSKVLSLLKKTGYMLSKQWSGLVLKKQTCSDLVAVPHDAWKHPDLVNYRAHKENSYHYCLCLYKSLVILLTVTTAVGRTTLCHPRWLSPSFMYMDISPTATPGGFKNPSSQITSCSYEVSWIYLKLENLQLNISEL